MFQTQNFDTQWTTQGGEEPTGGEDDNAARPPNAFILYSQAMRSQVRQDNPSLSNTEASRLLGQMWKDVPPETKNQYKAKAAKMQEDFKKAHPNYTYRKARRKRALTELLSKSSVTNYPYPPGGVPNYPYPMGMPINQMPMGQVPPMPMNLQQGQSPVPGMPVGQLPGIPPVQAPNNMAQYPYQPQ